ncbi:hypothetical protein AYK21_04410 [Thermoplasmatales archaeon SG8-52-2]|nr:MAG: hypothetical protein AYK21_04410 [Thermoplasmatales archaeon SG8-52-2]
MLGVIALFIGFGIQPAIATVEPERKILIDSCRHPIDTKSVIFEQLPYEPHESWIFRISDSDAGYRVWDEFWSLEETIHCIDWWGLSLTDPGDFISGNPEEMVFEIIFWDNLLGNPVCTYQVSPHAKGTFIFYNESEMFYWEAPLDPGCDISESWVSIQSVETPNKCYFLWAGSDEGNLYCYHEGATIPDQDSDCAYLLGAEGCYYGDAKIQCESVGMNFGKACPGTTVYGNIYIYNIGDGWVFLDWFVDTINVPSWGTWTFSPSSGLGLNIYDCVIINVSCILTDLKGTYVGTITVYNADDSTDFCEIDTSVEVTRNRASYYQWLELLIEHYPMLGRLLSLLL